MELSLLYLSLLLLPVSAESPGLLKVEPDSDQFLNGEIISLTCEEQWSVKRNRTGSDQVQSCGRNKDFGDIRGSRCVIDFSSSSDSGLYWCESAAGLRGPQRPLSVTDLILDSPALPVTAGSDITLRCRTSTGFDLSLVLVKDGSVVHSGSDWSFTVSKEHEGEYTCKDQTTGAESERRSLRVTESPGVLKVEPDSDQFLSGEIISLTCEEQWSVKRIRTESDQVQSCGFDQDFGVIEESSCVITNPSPSSASGLYWCESAAGLRGPQRPLSVTDRLLILDGPALPVTAGSDITLRCRTRPGSGLSPVLVKDGSVVHSGSDWSFTVSKEHEGEYTCKDLTTGAESERRSLRVTEPTTTPPPSSPPPSTPPPSSPPPPAPPLYGSVWVLWVLRPLLVGGPYGVCTVLLVLVYRGQRDTGSRRLVSAETGRREEEEEYDDVAAEVTTEHRF